MINHVGRAIDAAQIAKLAQEQNAVKIIVGCPYDIDGEVGPQARKSERMAEAIRLQTEIPVELWDESGSTQAAQEARLAMGVKRAKRAGHLDDLAATYILTKLFGFDANLRCHPKKLLHVLELPSF